MNELLTPDETKQVDRLMADQGRGVSLAVAVRRLAERAGAAVADAVAEDWPAGTRVLVVVGGGVNGLDGEIAARRLAERGFRVAVEGHGGPQERLAWASGLTAVSGSLDDRAHAFATAEVIVDAVYGAGLRPPGPDDEPGSAECSILDITASPAEVYAVDLPSGLLGATGEPYRTWERAGQRIDLVVQATRTITFQRKKPGHLLMPGRRYCGRVTVADIGIPDHVIDMVGPTAWENGPDLWRTARPTLADAGHKFDRGHVAVVSGPMAATGAARLSAMAAARAGAGLVTVASPGDALLVNAMHLTSVMVRKVEGPADLAALCDERKVSAVVIGPGLPPSAAAHALTEAALARPAVLDAGALISLTDAGGPAALKALVKHPCVLTPHPGEFARVFGAPEGGKLEATRAAAKATGAVVIHKGADTVIAAPDGRAAINANAPAWLATAGSGDVLAGIVAAFLGQGVPAFEAAAMGVYLHGEAGRAAGPAMIAEDLVDALRGSRAAFDGL